MVNSRVIKKDRMDMDIFDWICLLGSKILGLTALAVSIGLVISYTTTYNKVFSKTWFYDTFSSICIILIVDILINPISLFGQLGYSTLFVLLSTISRHVVCSYWSWVHANMDNIKSISEQRDELTNTGSNIDKAFKDMLGFKKLYESARIIAVITLNRREKGQSEDSCVSKLTELLFQDIENFCRSLYPLSIELKVNLCVEIRNILLIIGDILYENARNSIWQKELEVGYEEFRNYKEPVAHQKAYTEKVVSKFSLKFTNMAFEE